MQDSELAREMRLRLGCLFAGPGLAEHPAYPS